MPEFSRSVFGSSKDKFGTGSCIGGREALVVRPSDWTDFFEQPATDKAMQPTTSRQIIR